MNRVSRYAPNFCSGAEDAIAIANDMAELLAVHFVASWVGEPDFRRFSLSDTKLRAPWDRKNTPLTAMLAETEGGARWYVVCGLENPEVYGLPVWDCEEGRRLRAAAGIE